MAKKHEVSITFRKKVSKAGLPGAVKMATKAKLKGFAMDGLNVHEDYGSPVAVTRRRSSPTAKSSGKASKKGKK